jgi:UDP-N-acetylmuramoyl-tripeptide--D-alanyl-D-alanine ligase
MRPIVAYVWRRLMFRTTVIAITGSVGKTTTKECLSAILSTVAPTHQTANNWNDTRGVPRTVWAMRPWHRFAVIEVGTDRPGMIASSARIVKPHVAVVLSIARTHTNVFKALENTAAEKGRLLSYLPRGGTAILNGDDPHVRAMAQQCRANVVFFGRTPDCQLRALSVSSTWPDRLSMDVQSGSTRLHARTNLVGTHWASSVMAALATAEQCGMSLAAAVQAIAGVQPFAARMQPVTLPNGATLMRDEENGSVDSLAAMLKVMRESRAKRRILIVSDVSDSKRKPRRRQREYGEAAAELADLAIFTSSWGHHAVRAAVEAGMDSRCCYAVSDLKEAAELLSAELRSGDLVFIKGCATDHLSRVAFAQLGRIGCWRDRCHHVVVCDLCPLLKPEFDLSATLTRAARASLSEAARESRSGDEDDSTPQASAWHANIHVS